MNTLNRRRGIALLALIGTFISAYLFLYALGFYGELACGAGGGCSTVQASRWARFLGFPVAGWGLAWYVAVLAVSLLAIEGRMSGTGWVAWALLLLAVGGIAFTVYLKVIEFFVIGAVCKWCVASAVLALLIFLLTLPELRLTGESDA